MQEKLEAEKARKQSGLDPDTFEIFWFLQQEKLSDAMMLAKEISGVYQRFPNSASNADEHRQLKAARITSLDELLSPGVAEAACAYAVARLASDRWPSVE